MNLLEVGKTISAASREKISAAISALQALLTTDMATEARHVQAIREARMLLEADLSYSERETQVRDAIKASYAGQTDVWVCVSDCYDDYAIYSVEQSGPGLVNSKHWKVSYSILDGVVTLGQPAEVERIITYVPVMTNEAAEASTDVEIVGEIVPLVEARAVKDGVARVKIISPGVGTRGYYSPEVLARDVGKFVGAQCFWDHPTTTDEAIRPERSLRDLAGKITGLPTWEVSGPTGPGIYADVSVFKPYQEAVQELAPHIGMSIRGLGKKTTGDIDGKRMPIIEQIDLIQSVDFVTQAGRGGEILQLFEAARTRPVQAIGEVSQVTEQEAQALREANAVKDAAIAAQAAELARLQEALLLRDARDYAGEVLAAIAMPDLTRTRLVEALASKPVLTEGVLDRIAYKTVIEAAARTELEYLGKIGGSGAVRGLGGNAPPAGAALKESFLTMYLRQGMGEEQAEKLAASAAAGR